MWIERLIHDNVTVWIWQCELYTRRLSGAGNFGLCLPLNTLLSFAGKTTRIQTLTAITHWLLLWMEIKQSWGVRTTTKHLLGPRITPRQARLCSWLPTRGFRRSTALRPPPVPAPSPCPVRTPYTTITLCTTLYWTLCRPTWSTSALKRRDCF